jgi:hypothetical protein
MGSRIKKRAKYGRGSENAYLAQAENRLILQSKKQKFAGGLGFNKVQKKSFMKVYDTYGPGAKFSQYNGSVGVPILLNDLVEATPPTIGNRIGRKVLNHSLEFWVWVYPQVANVNLSTVTIPFNEHARVAFVYDRQNNNAVVPAPSDIFDTVVVDGTTGVAASLPLAPVNLDNQDRFLVLWDKRFGLSGFDYVRASASPGSLCLNNVDPLTGCVLFQGYLKLNNLPSIYSGTQSVGPNSGSIYLVVNSSVLRPSSAAAPWNYSFGVRLRCFDF